MEFPCDVIRLLDAQEAAIPSTNDGPLKKSMVAGRGDAPNIPPGLPGRTGHYSVRQKKNGQWALVMKRVAEDPWFDVAVFDSKGFALETARFFNKAQEEREAS